VKRGSMKLRSTTFDQATLDFRQFLSSHDWPTDVLWVRRSWLARKLTRRRHALNGEAKARAVYSRGVHAGLRWWRNIGLASKPTLHCARRTRSVGSLGACAKTLCWMRKLAGRPTRGKGKRPEAQAGPLESRRSVGPA
jgi:hypothetical protein